MTLFWISWPSLCLDTVAEPVVSVWTQWTECGTLAGWAEIKDWSRIVSRHRLLADSGNITGGV